MVLVPQGPEEKVISSTRWVRKHSPEKGTLEVDLDGGHSDRRPVEGCGGPGRAKEIKTRPGSWGQRGEAFYFSCGGWQMWESEGGA